RLFVFVSAMASFLAGMAGVVGGAFLPPYPGGEWGILIYALVVGIFRGLGGLGGAMICAPLVGGLHALGRVRPSGVSDFLLFRAVRSDGDPAAVPAARNLRQGKLNVGSYRIVLGLVALAAALLAPLAVGQFWMTLITQIYIYGLLALSVDLLLGHAGLYSL